MTIILVMYLFVPTTGLSAKASCPETCLLRHPSGWALVQVSHEQVQTYYYTPTNDLFHASRCRTNTHSDGSTSLRLLWPTKAPSDSCWRIASCIATTIFQNSQPVDAWNGINQVTAEGAMRQVQLRTGFDRSCPHRKGRSKDRP